MDCSLLPVEVWDGETVTHPISLGQWIDITISLNGNGYSDWAFLSVFGRAGYSFKDKYIFSGTVRRDGTSRLADQKYGVFPSVSGAWRIAEESFMPELNWLFVV